MSKKQQNPMLGHQPWHQLPIEQVFENLGVNGDGLTTAEVEKRRSLYGINELPDIDRRHWFWILMRQFKSLLVFILFGAAFISFLIQHWIDMYVILVVIAINAIIGFVQEIRAEHAVASLKSILKQNAKVIRDGQLLTLPAKELLPGDVVVLEEGDGIPADLRLMESKNLRVVEASLTGESVPIGKNTALLPLETSLGDKKNMLFKGTHVVGGYAKAVVVGIGINTAIGEIAQILGKIKQPKTNFQKKISSLARQMAIFAFISAVALFLAAWFFLDISMTEMLLISIATLVSAIPEGLHTVLLIVLAIGASRMTRRKVIIRDFTATETLGAVTTIITDKTGTLTQNTLTVRKISIASEVDDWTVTGEGWVPVGNFVRSGQISEVAETDSLEKLLKIAALCNNSAIRHDIEKDLYELVGDPTEGALLVLARKAENMELKAILKLDDLPFNSDLKMRATLVEAEGEKSIFIVGAPEQVLDKSTTFYSRSGAQPMTDEARHGIHQKIETWSNEAMRVIALAYKPMPSDVVALEATDINALVFMGIVGMIDPPRPEVKGAVAACKEAGIRVIMATGDHTNTALAVARATGITDADSEGNHLVLTEKQLLTLDEKEFEAAVGNTDVFARLSPGMKLRIAETLQKKGELIAMTGDGVNDAPALKKADVGVAMGIMGTDVARESAKVVLADDNFSTIVNAVEEGRIVFINVRQTTFFLVTTNFAEIITLVLVIVLGMPLPLTATQILWLNLVTDGLGDVALATERGHGDVLKQKPIDPKEKIINKSVLPFLLINAIVMTVLAVATFRYYLPEGLEKARTGAFVVMSFAQLFNLYNMRSLKLSVFRIGFFSNTFINIANLISVVMMVVIIQMTIFATLFGFKPLSLLEWVVLGALSSLILWVGELYKIGARRGING